MHPKTEIGLESPKETPNNRSEKVSKEIIDDYKSGPQESSNFDFQCKYNSEKKQNNFALSSSKADLTKEILAEPRETARESESHSSGFAGERVGKIQETRWADLKVGNVVCVKRDEFFPADLVIVASSDAKGKAHVETKNLDGETNLKLKEIPEYFRDKMRLLDKSERGQIVPDRRKSKIARRNSVSFQNVNANSRKSSSRG